MMPDSVMLYDDEVERITRVRVAHYLGKLPHEIDDMPHQDYLDIQAVIRADNMIREMKHEQATLRQR